MKKYSIEEVLPYITKSENKNRMRFGRYKINMSSKIMNIFKDNDLTCQKCGIKGDHFRIYNTVKLFKDKIQIIAINSKNILECQECRKKERMTRPYYIRFKIYTIKEVIPFTVFSKEDTRKEYDGNLIRMNSLRYQVFSTKGLKCIECGIEGKFFAMEKSARSNNNNKYDIYHFNLYALDEQGREVLMTKDHIIPKSKNGSNKLENLQPMCCICNVKKGSDLTLSLLKEEDSGYF